jgi:hypothetical protein
MKILGAAVLFAALSVQAQEIFTVTTLTNCSNWDSINAMLSSYHEQPMLQMTALRRIDNQEVMVQSILFANKNTGSYSLIEKWNDEQFCLVQVGQDLKPHSAGR